MTAPERSRRAAPGPARFFVGPSSRARIPLVSNDHPRRPGRVRASRAVVAAAAIGLVCYGALRWAGAARYEDLARASDRARDALARARAENAMVWAPEELLAAESAWREAQTALRIEQVRWWPLPDADRVAPPLAQAEAQAEQATSAAADRRRSAEEAARAAIDEAGAAVTESAELSDAIHVGPDRRILLARARTALDESRVYLREEDFSTAALRAQQAVDLARQVRDHAAIVAARYSDGETVSRWQQWKRETIDWSRRTNRPALVVSKAEHLLTLYVGGRLLRTFRADMGFNWISDKSHAGDGATPEGRYRVVARKANGASIYYKALLLDYPNAEDRAQFSRARRTGELPPSAAIGGLIEIHGEGGRGRDWTKGCVAVTNSEMDELFRYAEVGTPVTIVGSETHGTIADIASRTRDAAGGR